MKQSETVLSDEFLALQQEEETAIAERAEEGEQRFLESYAYFDGDSISEGLHLAPELLREAEELLKEQRYRDFEISTGTLAADPDGLPVGQASMTTDRGGYTLLRFNRRKLIYDTCTDWRCRKSQDPASYLGHTLCVHETALLLLMEKRLQEANPGDATNKAGALLMQQTAEGFLPVSAGDASERPLTLLPDLGLDENGLLYVSFRIGSGRLYKVKELAALEHAFQTEGVLTVGRGTALQIHSELFGESCRGYMQLICDVIHEEQCRADYLQPKGMRYGRTSYGAATGGYDFPVKDRLPLYGSRLDRFFEISSGRKMDFRRSIRSDDGSLTTQKGVLTCMEGGSRLTLRLSAQKDEMDGTFLGICLDGHVPFMIRGNAYVYMLQGETLRRTQNAPVSQIAALERLTEQGKLHVLIGRTRLNEFYRDQLPRLEKIFEIVTAPEDEELIHSYMPPEAELICYMDIDGGNLICRAQAVYGTHVHSLMPAAADAQQQDPRVSGIQPASAEAYRDRQREGALLQLLMEYFPETDARLDIFLAPAEDDVIYRLLNEGIDQFLSLGEVHSTQRFRRLGIRRSVNLRVGVSIESGLLDLQIQTGELSADELLSIIDGYHRKRQYVRLRSGDFLKLENNEVVQELGEMMEALHLSPREFVSGKMHLPAYRALYLDKMLGETNGIYADRSRSYKALVKRFKTINDADFDVPVSLKPVLRKYQTAGYRWLRTLDENGFGGILADEMGLGKTLQMISVLLASRQENPGEAPSLIVCPASLVYNWREEIVRFAPQLKTLLLVGSQRERTELIGQIKEADVVITSYDLLKRDIDQFEGIVFRYEVIDEAQFIKNHTTAAAKAVKLIRAQTKFALTGTPIENRLSELWSIFDYLMPGFLYDYTSFSRELERPIVRDHDEDALHRLKRMVTPFILRRLKMDVLKDLPEKLEEVRYAGMEQTQQQLYDAHVTRMRQELAQASEEEIRQNQIRILSELTQLRQICCDPRLLYENYEDGSAKRSACMDLIRGAIEGGHRMLLFSQFTQMLGLLEEELQREEIPYYIITGRTDKAKRLELVKMFNAGDVPVFLISLKAGGTGLNLTGADTVIHYDPWWNAAAENQAADRAHRIGQTRPVTVFKLIMKNTIEEKILELQEAKRHLAEDILSGGGTGSSRLSKDELLAILN